MINKVKIKNKITGRFIYFNFVQFLKFDFFIKINKFINILILN